MRRRRSRGSLTRHRRRSGGTGLSHLIVEGIAHITHHLTHLTCHTGSHTHTHHHSCGVHAAAGTEVHVAHLAHALHSGLHNGTLYIDGMSTEISGLGSKVGTMSGGLGLHVLCKLSFFAHPAQHIFLVIHLDICLTNNHAVTNSCVGSQLAEDVFFVLQVNTEGLIFGDTFELEITLCALVETDIRDIELYRPYTETTAQLREHVG